MERKLHIVFIAVLLWGPAELWAAKKADRSASYRLVSYMVVKGDVIKNIATRFGVTPRAILRPNKITSKNYVAYPGRILQIPVQIQPKAWDPAKDDSKAGNIPLEKRSGSGDYEAVADPSINEDFMQLSIAREDSIEYDKLDEHIHKIDRRISYLYHRIDSVKNTDFTFQYNEKDPNSVLGKMKLARDRYYLEGPLGRQIDSLNALKVKIGQRKVALRARIEEYEYLTDNATYNKHNYHREERSKDAGWGDHLAYESNLEKDKAESPAKNTESAPVSTQSVAVDSRRLAPTLSRPVSDQNSTPADPIPPATKSSSEMTSQQPANTVNAPPPVKELEPMTAVVKTETPAAPLEPAKAAETMKEPEMTDTGSADAAEADNTAVAISNHPKFDFALMAKLRWAEGVSSTAPSVPLAPLALLETEQIATPGLEPPKPPAARGDSSKLVPKSAQSIPKDTSRQLPKDKTTFASAGGTFDPLAVIDRQSYSLSSRYDSTFILHEKTEYEDHPGIYRTDSGIMTHTVSLKEVPVTEYRHKPKYLIPVDSVTRIKGDFFMLRGREALEKGDYKMGDKYIQKSLELNANNAAGWMLHADLFVMMGLNDQARKEYIISAQIDSANPKVFYNIALLYAKDFNPKKAFYYFSRAIEVDSKYILAYMGRASLEMDERHYDDAIEDYDKALGLNKYYTPAYKARGIAKMELRRFPDAIEDFNQFLEIEQPDGYVIYQRGISKIFSSNLLQGCLDLSTSQQLGFKEAEKAIRKFCQ